jgi:hypothetical protein
LRKIGILAFVALLALVVALPPAGATATGATYFSCKVLLPVWPTASGPPVKCIGKTTGLITGTTTAGARYTIRPNNSPFTAAATFYKEVCTGGEPLNGSAAGSISITGIPSVTPAGTAKADSIHFVWTRIGATALVNLSGGKIYLPGNKLATGQKGTSVAAFAPSKLGTCPNPAIKMTATIVGAVLFQS